MWNILTKLFGGGVSAVVDSASGLVKTVWGDRAAKDAAQTEEYHAALSQFAAEFVARQQRTWWDSFVDGINRLPRPMLVFGVMLSFIWPYIDPVGYIDYIRTLGLIPDPIWYICYAIVGFYFTSRTIEKLPEAWRVEPRVLDLAKELAAERTQHSIERTEKIKQDVSSSVSVTGTASQEATVSVTNGAAGQPASVVVSVEKQEGEAVPIVSGKAKVSGTRGVRNNNPGNIEGSYFGAIGNDGRFAIYEHPEDGVRAIDTQLTRYYDGKTTGKPLCTIRDMISTWAPRNENDTRAYIAHVAQEVGCSPDVVLEWSDIRVREKMIKAIIDHENGPDNPYTVELVQTALSSRLAA